MRVRCQAQQISNSCAGAAASGCLHLQLKVFFCWCCCRLQETADRDEANAALVQHLKAEADSRLHALQDAVTAAVGRQQQESSTIGSAVAEFLQQKDADLQALKVRSGAEVACMECCSKCLQRAEAMPVYRPAHADCNALASQQRLDSCCWHSCFEWVLTHPLYL